MSWSVGYIYSDQFLQDTRFAPGSEALTNPRIIGLGLVYAAVLIVILLGHEMGHYLACRHHGIEATLPFFIPAPTLIGTLGAFIKIKSPITRRNQLFDIGVAGPLTGFLLSLPALIYGLSLSKLVPAVPREDVLVFGEPLLLKLVAGLMFGNVSSQSDLFLHPAAFAAWVGILVTAFNLFPVGQLDGGHVSFALLGEKSKGLSRLFLGAFFLMGVFFWIGWIVWALVIMILGLRHPRVVNDRERLSRSRRLISGIILLVFVVSFIPAPFKGYSLLELLRQLLRQWGL